MSSPEASSTDQRPLRILIGCDTFAPDINGAARFAERLAAGLVQRGHDVHVSAPNQAYRRTPARTEVVEGEPMTLHRLPSVRWAPHDWIRFVWPWRSKHYARKVLDQVQPDVVHIQSHIVIGRGLAPEAGGQLAANAPAADPMVVPSALRDTNYRKQRDALLVEVNNRLQTMPEPEREKVAASLATLRRSIAEIEAALGRDPANALLQELLVNSCQEEMRALTAVRDSGSQET